MHVSLRFVCNAAACTFDAVNTRKLTCALGTIAMGDTRTIAIPCLADGSRLGKLFNVAVVNCDTPGQGTVDPKCKKTSPPAVVTVSRQCCWYGACATCIWHGACATGCFSQPLLLPECMCRC